MAVRRRRDIWDVVVIGGGLAGLTAANQASRRGLSVALFEGEAACGGQVATVNIIEDWPEIESTSGVQLAAAMVERIRFEGVEIFNEEVTEVKDYSGVLMIGAGRRALRARRVIAASGARLKVLGVPGEEALKGKGVSQCAHCDGGFFRDQDVAVIGGGDAALQEALVLAELCRSVSIVSRSRLRARFGYVDRAISKTNISFVWNSTVEEIAGVSGVTALRLRNVENGSVQEIACTGVFPFIGVEPNTAYLSGSINRDASGRVIVDSECRSSNPSLFAVGAVRAGFAGDLVNATGDAALAASAVANDLRL